MIKVLVTQIYLFCIFVGKLNFTLQRFIKFENQVHTTAKHF